MKQVPAGTKVDIDPETGAMKRLSGETRTNPYDLFALEAALQLREKVGGSVTVLTMGPPQAEEMMRDAYTMGADDAKTARCIRHRPVLVIENRPCGLHFLPSARTIGISSVL